MREICISLSIIALDLSSPPPSMALLSPMIFPPLRSYFETTFFSSTTETLLWDLISLSLFVYPLDMGISRNSFFFSSAWGVIRSFLRLIMFKVLGLLSLEFGNDWTFFVVYACVHFFYREYVSFRDALCRNFLKVRRQTEKTKRQRGGGYENFESGGGWARDNEQRRLGEKTKCSKKRGRRRWWDLIRILLSFYNIFYLVLSLLNLFYIF